MLIKNLIQTADKSDYGARADRSIQSGRVVLIDKTARELVLDIGMIDANGAGVYMHGVPYTPQTPPQFNDIVPLLRTNSSPYSVVSGSGAQLGGGNTGQIVESAGVNSIKKTGETTGQQGDLELEGVGNIVLTRTAKKFSFSEVNTATIGGLQQTGVSLVQNGSNYYYYYNSGVGSNQTFVLPQLILSSGEGQAITYTFINFSDYNVGVFASTTPSTNSLEGGIASLGIPPGAYYTFQGIQDVGSDGIWRVTNFNWALLLASLQTGTTYTLTLGDLGKIVETDNSSAVTVTVPANSSVKFPIGSLTRVTQIGTGQVTLAAAGGVTLHDSGGLATIRQYASMLLLKIGTDEWIVTNDVFGIAGLATTQSLSIALNNGGAALSAGQYIDVRFEYACTITSNTMLADQSGSVQLDLRKCTYSAFDDSTHPVSGDSICASAKPTITTAVKSTDSTLTGWTTAVDQGDIVRVYVVSATTITQVTLSLGLTRR